MTMKLNFFIDGFGVSMDVTKEAHEYFGWMEGLEVNHNYPDCIRKWEQDFLLAQEQKLIDSGIEERTQHARILASQLL